MPFTCLRESKINRKSAGHAGTYGLIEKGKKTGAQGELYLQYNLTFTKNITLREKTGCTIASKINDIPKGVNFGDGVNQRC